jgi:hypothetical protein
MKGDVRMRDENGALFEAGSHKPLVAGSNPSAAIDLYMHAAVCGEIGSTRLEVGGVFVEIGLIPRSLSSPGG